MLTHSKPSQEDKFVDDPNCKDFQLWPTELRQFMQCHQKMVMVTRVLKIKGKHYSPKQHWIAWIAKQSTEILHLQMLICLQNVSDFDLVTKNLDQRV